MGTAGSAILLVSGGYLMGSLPTAYLLGRWRLGIDVREVGTRNVGGANLKEPLGVWATVAVGATDLAKAALPVWLGLRLGLGEPTAFLAGAAAVIGHDWSIWLGFQGGRGAASTLGVLCVAFPAGAAWVLASLAMGGALRNTGLLHLIGVTSLPALTLLLGLPASVTLLTVGLATLMVVKRLEANARFGPPPRDLGEGPLPGSAEDGRQPFWLQRLLYDRDEDPAAG